MEIGISFPSDPVASSLRASYIGPPSGYWGRGTAHCTSGRGDAAPGRSKEGAVVTCEIYEVTLTAAEVRRHKPCRTQHLLASQD